MHFTRRFLLATKTAGRTVVRDPRKQRAAAAAAVSSNRTPSSSTAAESDRHHHQNHLTVPPPPSSSAEHNSITRVGIKSNNNLPFSPTNQQQESVGSSLLSYMLAGAGVALGFTVVGAIFGGI
mmetsp:Transcript_12144/g.29312  ORF Transcript_12144/g.29312 Transcript_12144/m.29312 type:complete len:123 (+) Transcript_12144:90-458(+)